MTDDRGLHENFRRLFEAHCSYVMKSLRRLGVREGDVEDVTHETFMAVLRRWDAFDASRPPRPWLFGFALRMASAYRQSARIRRERFEDVEPEAAASAEDLFAASDDARMVHRALDALDYEKRVVFVMFELDERSAKDIALELAIPENTVFSRLRAARAEFEAAVKRLHVRDTRSLRTSP